MDKPLPEKIRPAVLRDFVGQEHLVGKTGLITKLLHNSLTSNYFPSLIFWGPPGTGKTTLARIIASELKREFYEFSAVSASVKEIQSIIPKNSSDQQKIFRSPVVFLDEIHRFNKAQQDKLLPHVERGDIILIGATTENPSFEVIGALLSRTRVLVLNQIADSDMRRIIKRGEKELKLKIDPKAKRFLIESSNGDARSLLNILEIASALSQNSQLTTQNIADAIQRRFISFDKKGEEYFNVISAFIKSMRASQPNAALYYLARMIEAGQYPLYIARRMVIFASEDIGMAQPTALVVANEVFKSCEVIGYPECGINLAHGVIYLSNAKKDRSAYDGLQKALSDVRQFGNLPVPMNIRNAPTKLMKEIGFGKGYDMYTKESFLPEKIKNKKYI